MKTSLLAILAVACVELVLTPPPLSTAESASLFLGPLSYVQDDRGYNVGYRILLNTTPDAKRTFLGRPRKGARAWLNRFPVTIEATELVPKDRSPVEIDVVAVTVLGSIVNSTGVHNGLLSLTAPSGDAWVPSGDKRIDTKSGKYLYADYDASRDSDGEGEYSPFVTVVFKDVNKRWAEVARIESAGTQAYPFVDVDGDGFPEFIVATGKYSVALMQIMPSKRKLLEFNAD
jgi:hypothetical protein